MSSRDKKFIALAACVILVFTAVTLIGLVDELDGPDSNADDHVISVR